MSLSSFCAGLMTPGSELNVRTIWMGLVEMDRELFGTMGLVLHHHQTLRTLHSLIMASKTLNR